MSYVLVLLLLTGPKISANWYGPYKSEIDCQKRGEEIIKIMNKHKVETFRVICVNRMEV